MQPLIVAPQRVQGVADFLQTAFPSTTTHVRSVKMIDGLLIWIGTHQAATLWLTGLSVLLFVGSLLSLPLLVARIPEDYFSNPLRQRNPFQGRHPLAYVALRVMKNVLGWLLILSGLAMLALPGQGLLTIFLGLVLSDFPGKFTLERRFASNPKLLDAVNWLRQRGGHPPLLAPTDAETRRAP